MRTSLPPVKLIIHSTAFDLLMAVLEDNALNAPKESDRVSAKELMEKRARYTRFYTDKSGICASLRMYETEASEMIWQLLLAAVGNVQVRREYSKDLMGGDTDVPPGRDEGSV